VADADQANKALGTQLHELINTSKEVGGAQSRLATDLRSLQEGTEKQSSAARALSDRVTKLEEAQASAATTPTGEPSEAAKASFARLDRDVGTVKAQADRLSQRISDLKTELQEDLKGAAKSADVAPLAKKISAIEQELQQLAKSDAAHSANASRVVLALELTNLKRAMDRGEGYDKELAEVKKAAGDTLNLAPLERYTEGVPTQAELVRSFRKAANAMLDAEVEPAEGGWLDRLLSGTRSIVRVRKANPSGNDRSPEAVIARMEIALKEGRLDEVLAQSKKLPPKAELAGEEWLKNVEARATVDRALADIDAKLKASLGAGPNTGAEQR
jgi:hypothetical protein